jgi:putative addiction module component (TIGR02574 family)
MAIPLAELDLEQLSIPERLDLIGRLWDSISESSETVDVPDWHRDEVKRRLDDAENDPGADVPWEDVRKQLLSEG